MPPHTRSTVAPLPTFVPDFFTWAAQAYKFQHLPCWHEGSKQDHITFLVLFAALMAFSFQLGWQLRRRHELERLSSLHTRLEDLK